MVSASVCSCRSVIIPHDPLFILSIDYLHFSPISDGLAVGFLNDPGVIKRVCFYIHCGESALHWILLCPQLPQGIWVVLSDNDSGLNHVTCFGCEDVKKIRHKQKLEMSFKSAVYLLWLCLKN